MATTDFGDGVLFTGASADIGPFKVYGGRYAISIAATFGGGSVQLQQLMPDGSTYVAAAAAITANGTMLVDLPKGAFKLAVTTATAVQGTVLPVPQARNV